MNRITFLLGAGTSIPAGYDSTKCLTEKILETEGYFRHTDEKYYSGTASPGNRLHDTCYVTQHSLTI